LAGMMRGINASPIVESLADSVAASRVFGQT
jgi:hypothetical protein